MQQRLFHHLLWFLLVLITGLIGLRIYSDAMLSGRTVGMMLSTDDTPPIITGISSNSPAEIAGLEPEDVLIAINGRKGKTADEFISIAHTFRRDESEDFQVERKGRRLTLTVIPGVSFPWAGFLLDFVTTLGYLLIGLLAFFRAPRGERSLVLTFFSLAVAIEMALPERLIFVAAWPTIRLAIFYVLSGLQMGLEFHLASIIPKKYPWFIERSKLPGLYYLAGLGIGCSTSLFFVLDQIGVPGFELVSTWSAVFLNDIILILWGLGIIAILVIQLRQSTTRSNRNQTLLILTGVIPWTLFNTVHTALGYLDIPRPEIMDILQPVVLLLYPILIFVAIFRYHLLDVQLVIRRSLVLFIVTAIIIVVFSLIFETGTSKFGSLVATGKIQIIGFSIGMLLLGLAFNPIRNWVQTRVDRQFFPERFETRDRLAELAATLPTLGNLSDMGWHLVEKVSEIFKLESATLLVADPHSRLLVSLASTTPSVAGEYGVSLLLEGDDPGIRQIKEARRVVSAELISAGSPALAQRIQAVNAAMGIGLVNGDVLVGILLLGPPTVREELRPEELDLIQLFALNIATVLENIRLFESTRYEQLTGLFRREAILKALGEEMQRSARYFRPLTVGMIDLDFFKRVNDTWGHLTGDTVLQRVAQCLQTQLRTTDRIGRYGGEEFLFFLPETELVAALHVAEKLRQVVSQLDFQIAEAPDLRITISIGLAELEHGGVEEVPINSFINAADQALLQAKRSGRNRVVAA